MEKQSLFSDEIVKLLPDGQFRYFPSFYAPQKATHLFESLLENIAWQQDPITLFGKTYLQPRLTALYAINDRPYSYSGIQMHPHPMTPLLKDIQQQIESICATTFTSVLLNLYRDGQDSNGWHADDEKELGINPVIASLSLGAERFFHLKHHRLKEERHKLLLEHGSLLIMEGAIQHHWKHQIAKTKRPMASRINLTFRKIV